MLTFLVRRLAIAFVTLILITFVVYALIRNMPGNPALAQELMDLSKEISEEDLKRRQEEFGLNVPWYQGYVIWVGRLVQGDMGTSFSDRRPVTVVIGERVPRTLSLSISSLSLSYLLSIPLGLYATVRRNLADERAVSVVLYMLYSVPSFVAALFLQITVAWKLGLLPLTGAASANYNDLSPFEQILDVMQHAILPVAVLTYTSLAYYSRFIRSNMLEVINQDYIRTARAKGVHPITIILRHAFRNTLIPFVTLIALTMPALLGGSVIVEQIFAWPGMGQLLLQSIQTRDYEVLMGLVLIFSVLTLAGQLLADLLYSIVDPRVSLS